MKFTKFFYIFAIVFVVLLGFAACKNKDEIVDNSAQNSEQVVDEVSVDELGFLHFSSCEALESYANEIAGDDIFVQDAANASQKLLAKIKKVSVSDKSFVSMASWRNKVLSSRKYLLKAATNGEDDEDDEILTDEEQRLAEIDEMLQNDLLYHILDTALRIQVSDTVFKITPYGTFAVERAKIDMLNSTIATFDTMLINTIEAGVSVRLDNGILFTNTFGKSGDEDAWVGEFEDNDEEETSPENAPRRTPQKVQANRPVLHLPYSVNSYSYKKSDWQNFWSRFFSKSGHLKHTKKRRSYMTISNLDYGFFKTCQVVLKFQKKNWLGCWVKMVNGADKLVIGVNSLTLTGGGLREPLHWPTGVEFFYNKNEVKRVFGWSVGIGGTIKGGNISYKDISPAAPSCYKMSDIDVFGSIWAEGRWAGVRFYSY